MRHGVGDADGRVVAVIGDGAMTGGVAFEAIHQAGGLGTPLVVVLNDNGMSISPNVGALSPLLQPRPPRTRAVARARGRRGEADQAAGRHRRARSSASARSSRSRSRRYLGARPVVGGARLGLHRRHRRPRRRARCATRCARRFEAERPVVVHVATVKGKGFAPAEEGGLEGMEKWHAAKPKSIAKRMPAPAAAKPTRRQARAAAVHAGVRRGARARVPARRARGRHHRGDELRHRPLDPPEGAARALLRRRHRRAAGGAVRRRPRAPGRAPGVRDLLDLPAARLRPDRPRRLPAEPAGRRSAWTAPGSSATTARPTTARSTSPTCAACPTSR